MEADGLVRRKLLTPAGQSVVVYELTQLGTGLAASLIELARWGMRTLPPSRANRTFRSQWLVLALNARFDPGAATGIDESYEFRVDGDVPVRFEVTGRNGIAAIGAATDPAVIITADAGTFLELTSGTITPGEAAVRGASIEGSPAAIARMRALLPIPASSARLPRAGLGACTTARSGSFEFFAERDVVTVPG
jgi:hypothetical protein